MATPIVLSSVHNGTDWVSYYPQTTVDAVITSAEKQFVSAAQIASFTAAEQNAKTYTDTKIADLVSTAPEALDTLAELAAALQSVEGSYNGLMEVIGNKATTAYVDEQLALKADATALAAKADATVIDTLATKAELAQVSAANGTKVTMAAEAPVDMKEGDIFLKIIV